MSSADQRSLNWLGRQFQLKPGKPAILASLRTLLGISGPIGVGTIIGHPAASAIAVMAALFVGMVDVGGAYRQKATAMIAATIGVTLALLLANLVSGTLWLSLPTTFVVMFIAGLVGLYGRKTATVSLVISIMFIVALARFAAFPNLSTVFEQCGLCLAGGIWAMMLSLVLWVVRPYTPTMQAVAKCYLSLSQLVESASKQPSTPQDRQEWAKQFLSNQDTVTQDLNSARSVWLSVWRRYDAASLRGNQLLMLIEDANQILISVVALVELLAISSSHPVFQQLQSEIQQVMAQLTTALKTLSRSIEKQKTLISLGELDRSIEALEHERQVVRSQVVNQKIVVQTNDFSDLVNIGKIAARLNALAQQVHADADIIVEMQQGERRSIAQRDIPHLTLPNGSSIVNLLRENLTFHSVHFRHALRLAVITTSAELLAKVLQVPRGYWITLTAVVALKPDFGGTSQTTVQRVLGTIVGGVIGIALVLLIKNPVAILLCLLLLMVTALSIRPLSYSLFITLLTPVVILLLNVLGTGGWKIGTLRILDSLIGGGLALLGSYILFPSWEQERLPAQLATAIQANLAYFQQVSASYLNSGQVSSDSISKLRQQAALENANAAAAIQRLFNEPRHVRGEVEPVTTLMIYIRSFFSSVTALAEQEREFSGEYHFDDLRQFADAIVQILANAADSLQQGRVPAPLPELNNYLETIRDDVEQLHTTRLFELKAKVGLVTSTSKAIQKQTPVSLELERIAYEVTVMHCVITRWQKAAD